MSIELALADAARNCALRGATTAVTLRNGVRLVGKLERENAITDTRMMRTPDGGWLTFLTEEVVVVESRP